MSVAEYKNPNSLSSLPDLWSYDCLIYISYFDLKSMSKLFIDTYEDTG